MWIKTSERLPEVGEWVLTWNITDAYAQVLQIRACKHKYWEDGMYFAAPLAEVTHWRPLPAPPED